MYLFATQKSDVAKINTLEILIQFDGLSSEQQNITHVTAFGTKTAFYFTDSSRNGVLKF
jgi:hypothetical protein